MAEDARFCSSLGLEHGHLVWLHLHWLSGFFVVSFTAKSLGSDKSRNIFPLCQENRMEEGAHRARYLGWKMWGKDPRWVWNVESRARRECGGLGEWQRLLRPCRGEGGGFTEEWDVRGYVGMGVSVWSTSALCLCIIHLWLGDFSLQWPFYSDGSQKRVPRFRYLARGAKLMSPGPLNQNWAKTSVNQEGRS